MHNDVEKSLADKEANLLSNAKQLENMKASLFEEKAQAMEVLQRAARVVEQERMKAMETSALQKERKAEAGFQERERQLSQTAQELHREKVTLEEEKAKLRALQEALERERYEQSQIQYQQMKITEAQEDTESRKWDGQNRWREGMLQDVHCCQHSPETYAQENSRDSNLPLYHQTGHIPNAGATSETSSRAPYDCIPGNSDGRRLSGCTNGTNASWEDLYHGSMLLSSQESGMPLGSGVHHMSPEKRAGDTCSHHHEKNTPSKKRLENVMKSLKNAREASRSRLQRTENALLGFPPSSPFTTQIQQALNALSSKLTLMEQIEDGLNDHLQKALDTKSPDEDGLMVDKVQLLRRMEEQQSLRAEWEEDMQQQLETISMLQAASRSSTFPSPSQGAITLENVQTLSPPFDWPGSGNGDANHGNLHASQESMIPDMARMTAPNSGSSGSNTSPDWKTRFEPLLGVDSSELSFSPLVDYHYYPSCNQNLNQGKEQGVSHKFARRKLHLSASITGNAGAS
jgi:hypothetical protein